MVAVSLKKINNANRGPGKLLSRDTKEDVERDTKKRSAVREHGKTQQYASVLEDERASSGIGLNAKGV